MHICNRTSESLSKEGVVWGLCTRLHNGNILQEFRGRIRIKHIIIVHIKIQCKFSFTLHTKVSTVGIHLLCKPLLMHKKFIVCRHWELQGLVHPLCVWKEDLGGSSGMPSQLWDQSVELLKASKTRDCPVGPRLLAESIVELGNDEIKMYSRWIVLKLCHGGLGIGRN